jgi:hypothetical protein
VDRLVEADHLDFAQRRALIHNAQFQVRLRSRRSQVRLLRGALAISPRLLGHRGPRSERSPSASSDAGAWPSFRPIRIPRAQGQVGRRPDCDGRGARRPFSVDGG